MLRRKGVAYCFLASAVAAFLLPVARAEGAIESEAMSIPALEFELTPEAEKNFDKYFYFHRGETDFSSALRDLQECDDLSSGRSRMGSEFGLVGSVVADLIHGSAARREMRRASMRRCMNYKGYDRYGISKSLWVKFNFEEGVGKIDEDQRLHYLKVQAKVAAESSPKGRVLGL